MSMQVAAIVRNPRRVQSAHTKSLTAPVGGWNDRDPLSSMAPEYAVILDNMFCLPSKVTLRKGMVAWSTGLGAQVESVMGYNPQSGTAALFGAASTKIYNVTASGAVGAAVVTGLTNARFQHVNMGTAGGSFLMAVNGADKLRGWDGSAWWVDGDTAHDITGVDTATWTDIGIFKRRLWGIQKNTAKIWYLAVDSIAGAATSIDFGPLFPHGGTLKKMVNWSIDAGVGIDDYAAFISDQGDIALYKGSDPASATTWALVGVFYIGSPIGQRCAVQYGKDVLVICKDGLVPLSIAIMSGRLLTNVALTDKIQNTTSAATTLYGTTFGWQIVPYPGENMILLNVPVAVGVQQQYVMNTISGAWSRFKGWPANCFEIFGDELYFGGNGSVYKAWSTRADAGSNINAEALQAFSYFGSKDDTKEFTLARPMIAITNNVGVVIGLNTNFNIVTPTGVPTFVTAVAGQWGTGQWGSAKWGGQPKIQQNWQGAMGVGRAAAMHMTAASANGQLEWYSTDYAWRGGGIL